MFQKFIINREGVLKFGRVYLHRDMLAPGEQCTYGGGLWKIDEGRGAIVLYGRSFWSARMVTTKRAVSSRYWPTTW